MASIWQYLKESRKQSKIEKQKEKIKYFNDSELIDFIEKHTDDFQDYLRCVSSNGNARFYSITYECNKYFVIKAFDDDSFRNTINVVRKRDKVSILYLSD